MSAWVISRHSHRINRHTNYACDRRYSESSDPNGSGFVPVWRDPVGTSPVCCNKPLRYADRMMRPIFGDRPDFRCVIKQSHRMYDPHADGSWTYMHRFRGLSRRVTSGFRKSSSGSAHVNYWRKSVNQCGERPKKRSGGLSWRKSLPLPQRRGSKSQQYDRVRHIDPHQNVNQR